MKKTLLSISLTSLIAATSLLSTQAFAVEGLSANVGATSNYLWRGVSQTANAAAISGGIDYEADSGFYAGTWASNIDFGDEFPPGTPTDPEGITGPKPSSKSSAPSDPFGGYYDTNTFDMSNPDAWMQAPTAKPKDTRVNNKKRPVRPRDRNRGGGSNYHYSR